ncbi:MAG TPA: ABC transporter ATP-binding protein [Gemmatimonadales bacterium]|nr:ABC transporter ATP-binding protein [Gemmatimonadales bacterium]
MLNIVRQALDLCDPQAKREIASILVVMVLMALTSTVGIAAIMPFLSLVANPDVVQQNAILRRVYSTAGFSSTNQFLFAIGVLTLVLLMVSNGLRALTDWKILSFVRGLQYRISRRLLAQYLSEPYMFFVSTNTSKLSQKLLSEVNSVMAGLLVPGLRGIAQLVVALFILSLLIAVDPWLALFVTLGLGSAYGAIFMAIRRRQLRLGREWIEANAQRYRVVGEAFGGIKDVKALGRERHFLNRFEQPSLDFARAVAANEAMTELPRYALEAIAFGGILVIVLYLLGSGGAVSGVLPLLGLYAFAAYRLMPSLQQLFKSASQVRFHSTALGELHHDLAAIGRTPVADALEEGIDAGAHIPPLKFENEVLLRDVHFSYPGSDRPALRGVNIVLPRNQTIGLVGPTGSGKTTLVDLLLGLYMPDAGQLEVDGVALGAELLPSWRRMVGYVPQSIFLSDDTIGRNIAFGIPDAELDREAVERAARTAQLHDFILTLPQGYDTITGERGVRLSGGQRQRIGIARALYHDPDILIMDEATSALDTITEDAVMDAIRRLAGQKTMVLIAHRITTVTDCDNIYLLDGGEVVAAGNYDELRGSHSMFRAMSARTAVKG